MVAFLLITAVWTQLARLSASQKGQGQAGEETPPEQQVNIVVVVNQEGFNLVVGQEQTPIPKKGDAVRLREARHRAEEGQGRPPRQERRQGGLRGSDQVRHPDQDHGHGADRRRFPDISLVDTGAAGI